jgi:hypothetical protein
MEKKSWKALGKTSYIIMSHKQDMQRRVKKNFKTRFSSAQKFNTVNFSPRLERWQIIEYSRLSDDTYTNLSSYRYFLLLVLPYVCCTTNKRRYSIGYLIHLLVHNHQGPLLCFPNHIGDEYEESQKCLSGLAERSCIFLYCIWIILAMYIFYCIFWALAN